MPGVCSSAPPYPFTILFHVYSYTHQLEAGSRIIKIPGTAYSYQPDACATKIQKHDRDQVLKLVELPHEGHDTAEMPTAVALVDEWV